MHYALPIMEVLQLDMSGRPQAWISAKEAAVIYASDGVAWTLGDAHYVLRGGLQRRTGLQSRIEVHPIIAVRGAVPSRAWRQALSLRPPLPVFRKVGLIQGARDSNGTCAAGDRIGFSGLYHRVVRGYPSDRYQ